MIQFTEEEINQLQSKAVKSDYIMELLKNQIKVVYEEPLLVPEVGIGNWSMYYFCKECSVQLIFDRKKPFEHVCPHCNKAYTGEPYDSTWWGIINSENYKASYAMGLLYVLTDAKEYGRKAADIMLTYAKYYLDYEVHGDIPYNGPGKANAQTLDEAIFIRTFAMTYDLISNCMTEEEQTKVKECLLIPGGEFLMEHRHPQIHNHEVIIDSAIAIVGILFEREDMIHAGLHSKYGLIYQLEHGMQEDYMWFEGTFGYHYYALESFFAFEKFAIHTQYSNIKHPNYQNMLELILEYVQEDGKFPLLNDIYVGHGGLAEKYIYEFAYKHLPSKKMLQIINLVYKKQERKNLDAFFYGVSEFQEADVVFKDYHSDKGSGHTILRGEDGRYLIFKHGSFGGEHDHYDCLGISYQEYGKRIAPDMGTTGYGALLHYEYYKNTGTHNTVTIGEENQPPVCGKTLRYETVDGITYIEAKADWSVPYEIPDSFVIKQWDEECYQNVSMIRKIAWANDYMVDVFIVDGVQDKTIDWTLHIDGERITKESEETKVLCFSDKKPLKYLKDVTCLNNKGMVKSTFVNENVKTNLFSYISSGQIFFANGPDNPSIQELSYIIQRVNGRKAMFVNVLQSYKEEESIKYVSCLTVGNEIHIKIGKEEEETIVFDLE